MRDELGDVLFQVVFLSLLLEEQGEGDLAQIATQLTAKLIRRHPHVYPPQESGAGGSVAVRSFGPIDTADDVRRQWDRIKQDVEGRTTEKDWRKPGLPALTFASQGPVEARPGRASGKRRRRQPRP